MRRIKKILAVLALVILGFLQGSNAFAQTISPISKDGLEIYVYDPHTAIIKVRNNETNKEASIIIYDDVTSMQYGNLHLLVSDKFCYKVDKNPLKISSDTVENCRAAFNNGGGEANATIKPGSNNVVASTGKRITFGNWEISFGDMTHTSTNGKCEDSLIIRNIVTKVSSSTTDAGKCFNDGQIKNIYGDSRYDQFIINFSPSGSQCYDIKTQANGAIYYSRVSDGNCKVGKSSPSQPADNVVTVPGEQSGVEICENMNIPKSVRAAAGCNVGKITDVREVVLNIVRVVIGVLGLVCVIVVVYGGVTYMTSNGDANKIQKAKAIIKYALVGLIICALAFSIVNFIVGALAGNSEENEDEPEVTTTVVSTTTSSTTSTTVTASAPTTTTNNEPVVEPEPEPTTEPEPEPEPAPEPTTEPEPEPEPAPAPEPEPTPAPEPKPAPTTTTATTPATTTTTTVTHTAAPTTAKDKLVNTINSLAWPYTSKKADRESRAKSGATSAYVAAARAVKITDGVATEPYYQKSGEYKNYKDNTNLTYHECRLNAMSCAMFVGTVYRYSGVDPSMGNHPELVYDRVTKNPNLYEKVNMRSINDAQGGDIAVFISKKGKARHVEILTEVDGKIYTAKGSVCLYWPFVYKKEKLPTPGENDDHIEYFRHK